MSARTTLPALLLLPALAVWFPAAVSGTTFSAAVGGIQSWGSTAPQAVGPIEVFGGVGSTGHATSVCEVGRLRGHSDVTCPVSGLSTPQIDAPTQAEINISDIQLVTAPEFGDPRNASMTLHMRLTGDLSISGAHPYAASVTVRAMSISTDCLAELSLNDQGLAGTGILAGAPAHLVDYPLDMPVVLFAGNGFPQSILLSFETRAGGTALGTEINSASSDFSQQGFHLPSNGPVFDLPPGLSISIPSLNIVDNRWVDPTAGVAPVVANNRLTLAALQSPAHGTARFALALPEGGAARAEVFDVRGRRVATLLDGWQAAGLRELTWDGARGAGAGVYFVRVTQAHLRATTRIVIVK